jgi:5-methylcytosine-specific restriction protein B
MVRVKGCEAVYEVADQWRERCLIQDESLLWPDLEEPTWTVESLERARDIMDDLVRAKTTTGGHMEERLRDEPDPIKRAIADATAVWNLCPGGLNPGTRKGFVKHVASWATGEPELALVSEAIDSDIGGNEASYFVPGHQLQRGAHLRFILEFARRLKAEDLDIPNLTVLRELSQRIFKDFSRSHSARNMVLHILFPDSYEAVFNNWAKDKIANAPAFSEFVEGITDWDDRLVAIREGLEQAGQSSDFDFYDHDVLEQWRPKDLAKAKYWLFQCNPQYYDMASDLVDKEPGWLDQWNVTAHRDEMHDGDSVVFWQSGSNGGLVAMGCLVGEPYEGDSFHDPDEQGWWVKWQLEQKFDVPLTRKQLDKHPVLRQMRPIAPPHVGTNFPMNSVQWNALMEMLGLDEMLTRAHGGPDEAIPPGLQELADLVFLDVVDLSEIESLLHDKGQITFEGPPGSGKTYVARLIARYMAGLPLKGDPDPQVEIVQFHQSYGYEDFVAGIRPRTTPEGTIRYDVQPGIFVEMCKRADANPAKNFVLIIDEINRGNLSRIFGELLYALEYRDEPVRIQYPDMMGDEAADHLTIPNNLYLIGTMNSTDRSLAMIDYALRRRFYFWALMPVVDHQAPVLEGWLRSRGVDEERAQDLLGRFIALNERIAEQMSPDHQIGHSYLMVDDLENPEILERVWKRALLPLLGEYFHNRRDREALIDELRGIMFGN